GIGALPEQEIAEPLLAARADEEIGIGKIRRLKMAGDHLLADIPGGELARLHLLGDLTHRARNLRLTAVAQRNRQNQLAVMLRAQLYFLNQRLDIFGQSIDVTDKIDFDAGFGKGVDLFVEKIAKKTHQMIDLFNRAAPVLRREGEQRQVADAEIAAAAHGLAHRLGPLLMSAQTLERSLRCP